MTAEVLPPEPVGRGWRDRLVAICAGWVMLVLAAAVVAAVIRQGDDGESVVVTDAGGRFVPTVAQRTEALEHLRLEMSLSMQGGGLAIDDATVMTGEVDGERQHLVLDFTEMFDAVGVSEEGVAMEMYSDGSTAYVRAPLFSQLEAGSAAVPAGLKPLVHLGDSWGRVDMAAVDASLAAELSSAAGGVGDLSSFLHLLDAAEDVREAGRSDVRGAEVTLYAATITFGDLLEADGFASDTFASFLPDGDPESSEIMDVLSDIALGLDVAVDDDGNVRRVAFGFDEEFMVALAGQLGEPVPGDLAEFEFEAVAEIYDVDDPSVTVEIPQITDAADLTDWAIDLAGPRD